MPTFHFTDQQKELTQKVVKELEAYYADSSFKSSTDVQKMPSYKAWATTMSDTKNSFGVKWTDNNKKDQSTIVNPNDMTLEQVEELSNWTAAILNQLTSQLGIQNDVGKTITSEGMPGMALEVANLTSENNQSGGAHYLYGLNKAAYDFGLTDEQSFVTDKYKNNTYLSNTFGESAGGTSIWKQYSEYTMADAKEEILGFLEMMMDSDANQGMGHTTAILGINNLMSNSKDVSGQVLGVSISGNKNNNGGLSVHIIGYDKYRITPSSDMFKWNVNDEMFTKQKEHNMDKIIENPYENLAATKNNLEQQLLTAKKQLNNDNAKKTEADNNVASAQKDVVQKQAAADISAKKLSDAINALSTAKNKLDKANDSLTIAQNNLRKDKNSVKKVAKEHEEAQKALKNYQDQLQTEKSTLDQLNKVKDSAQSDLNNANEALNTAKEALAEAKEKLKEDQSNLEALENLPKAHKNYDVALAEQTSTQDKYNVVKSNLQKTQQANQSAKSVLAALSAKLNRHSVTAGHQLRSNVVKSENGFYDNIVSGPNITNQTVCQTTFSVNNDQKLPQTGNTNDSISLVGLALASLAGMFGLAGIKRRN